MKFLCVVYFEPSALAGLSADERATVDRDSLAYDVELQRRGKYIVANALAPVSTARTVRVRRGKAAVTDGPFAETKEHLGGFILVDAADMDEAVELAKGIPMAKLGTIEVRPIMELKR
jgi:hypothetical protein